MKVVEYKVRQPCEGLAQNSSGHAHASEGKTWTTRLDVYAVTTSVLHKLIILTPVCQQMA